MFLCDDAPELRALLRAFLEWGGDVEIVGEAEDGEGLAEAVRDAEADVVLLDLSMPRVDGLEALAELRADDPALGIVVLSGFEPTRMARRRSRSAPTATSRRPRGWRTSARPSAPSRPAAAARARCWRRSRDRPPPRRDQAPARELEARERQALEIHDNLVQGLTAIHWALEAGAYEQAKEATRTTLAQARPSSATCSATTRRRTRSPRDHCGATRPRLTSRSCGRSRRA